MSEAAWQRAMLLYQQQRWDMAEKELRGLLAQDPEFAPAYAMLGIILSQSNRLDEALAEARQAVTIDPEGDFGYHAVAVVYVARRELREAVTAVTAAIDLNPEDASHRGLLAQIHFYQERWADAVQSADAGLAISPDDTDCLNLRSLALTKLGRSSEATASVTASLARDPDNPYTHQTLGYAKLHQGDAKQALHHFQEALRRDPTLDGSRQGLVEALKARNPIYRMVLGWFLWFERFEPQRRTQVLIGIWLGAQVGRKSLAAAGYETAAIAVSYSWLAFVLLTACAVPIFNLLLLLHPVGRHALERSARNHAVLLGSCLLITTGMFVCNAIYETLWLPSSQWFWLIYLLPIAGLGVFISGWGQRAMQAICAGLLLAWLWWLTRVLTLEHEVEAIDGTPLTPANEALMTGFKERFATLMDFQSNLILAAALSTWFVMLAPKGHQIRRR
jgi:tetratricopeptide (TPR) repeat protein